MNDQPQPKKDDAVLGRQIPPTGAVLGGIEGVKQRFSSGVLDQQIAAASEASHYGEAGLNLLLQALKQEESKQLRWAAYAILSQRTESAIAEAVFQHSPYRSFQHLYNLEERDSLNKTVFAVSPDSQHLITHNGNEMLKVWDLKTGILLQFFQGNLEERVFSTAMTISPDGQTCVIAYSPHERFIIRNLRTTQTQATQIGNRGNRQTYLIKIKSLKTGQTTRTLIGQGSYVGAIALSSDGQTLVVGTKENGIEVWDLMAQRSNRLENKSGYVQFVGVSPDGQRIVSESGDTLKVWQRHTGELLHTLTLKGTVKGSVQKLVAYISRDGKTVVAVSDACLLNQWDLQTGKRLYSLKLNTVEPYGTGSFGAVFSPDGQTLLTTYAAGLSYTKLWHWQTGELLHSIAHGQQDETSAIFSPSGQFAVTGCSNGIIQVWGLPPEAEP